MRIFEEKLKRINTFFDIFVYNHVKKQPGSITEHFQTCFGPKTLEKVLKIAEMN